MADFACYDYEVFHVRLRGPWQDYETFLNSDFPSGPIVISFEHNAEYEIYNLEYSTAVVYEGGGEYVIYICSMDNFESSYWYEVEADRYVSPYDDSGNLGTGYGLKLFWFRQQQRKLPITVYSQMSG